jgi:hypothetical protein
MSYNWGPHYIVPSESLKSYSGGVLLREEYDEGLLDKELKELGFSDRIVSINNPWYFRRKNSETWIQIGESQDKRGYFSVRWDTSSLENGQYEIMGLMHVYTEEPGGTRRRVIARENIVEVTVEN